MKTYKKIRTIKAKVFEEGDQDGKNCIPYVNECAYKNEKGLYKQCDECKLEIPKMPFIKTLENNNHYGNFINNYICYGINGKRWLVERTTFEKTYEEVKE